jgi:hypothetical protein
VILAFSTSSPQASVALLSERGEVLASDQKHAPMQASGACFELLEALLLQSGIELNQATLVVADLGPGSFTGVKVAATIAKTLAFALDVKAAGATSFDLVSPSDTVVLPSKKGEYFIRVTGREPSRSTELPSGAFQGYGLGIETQSFPHAANFGKLLENLIPVDPEYLVPNYLIEPSISLPKHPLSPLDRSDA